MQLKTRRRWNLIIHGWNVRGSSSSGIFLFPMLNQELRGFSAPLWINLQEQQLRLGRASADTQPGWECRTILCVLWAWPNSLCLPSVELTWAQRVQRWNRISQQLSPARGRLLPGWQQESPKSTTNYSGISFSFSWESFDWNLEKYHHVEFRSKEKGGFVQSGPERWGAAAGKGSHFLHFCCLLHDRSFMNSLRGESQASFKSACSWIWSTSASSIQPGCNFPLQKKAEMIQTDSEQQIHEGSEFL